MSKKILIIQNYFVSQRPIGKLKHIKAGRSIRTLKLKYVKAYYNSKFLCENQKNYLQHLFRYIIRTMVAFSTINHNEFEKIYTVFNLSSLITALQLSMPKHHFSSLAIDNQRAKMHYSKLWNTGKKLRNSRRKNGALEKRSRVQSIARYDGNSKIKISLLRTYRMSSWYIFWSELKTYQSSFTRLPKIAHFSLLYTIEKKTYQKKMVSDV